MHLVKLGSFTVVARSPLEAVRLLARLMDEAHLGIVMMYDMGGFPVDLEDVNRESEID
jgi:hypothetical protein